MRRLLQLSVHVAFRPTHEEPHAMQAPDAMPEPGETQAQAGFRCGPAEPARDDKPVPDATRAPGPGGRPEQPLCAQSGLLLGDRWLPVPHVSPEPAPNATQSRERCEPAAW